MPGRTTRDRAGRDRTNLLATLNAKQAGADLCLSVVSREEFVPLVDALGLDAAFAPRLVTAEAILRAVRGENVHAMHLLLGGAEVVEVEADSGCRAEKPPGRAGRIGRRRARGGDRAQWPRRYSRSERAHSRGRSRARLQSPAGVADVQRAFKAA